MRRCLSVWCPHWPTERRWRHAPREAGPFALVDGDGRLRLTAVDRHAAAAGLAPGMPFAEARGMVPALRVARAEPGADAAALAGFAEWCAGIWTPLVALDPPDGVMLDVTGCAHLFGGEEGLLADLHRRLARTGLTTRTALADTPGAARALARHGAGGIVAPGGTRSALAPLSVRGLGLPAETVARLEKLGLAHIGDLYPLPRAVLARRLGAGVPHRLDQVLGRTAEAIVPHRPPTPWRVRRTFAEPVGRHEDVERILALLLDDLCRRLGEADRGVRRLDLVLCRVDGTSRVLTIGTARPERDPRHLLRLFAPGLERVEPGFGIETVLLDAPGTQALPPAQDDLATARGRRRGDDGDDLARFADRLRTRFGARSLVRLAPVDSHVPERAVAALSPESEFSADWNVTPPRPVCLLARPEPVAVMAPEPDAPPARFRWRGHEHHVARTEGPERIAAEWWREPPTSGREVHGYRDYYRVEDTAGRRFWLFRAAGRSGGETPGDWYLHGLFA